MDYIILNFLSVRGEMKFRDPQFNVKSEYSRREVNYDGNIIRLPQESFDSKINVDGVAFVLVSLFIFK